MLYILYNSLSKTGKKNRLIQQIVKKAIKTFKMNEYKLLNLIQITQPQNFIKILNQYKDIVIIIGGDGTLYKIANEIYNIENLPKIYCYKAGTGNDFLRSIKEINTTEVIEKKFFLLNPYLKSLPVIQWNNNNNKNVFLNGTGIGLDAHIANGLNEAKNAKSQRSFFKFAYKEFKNFKAYDTVVVKIDGKEIIFKDVLLISIMNGKYYGGGMKIAPYANRLSNTLDIIIFSQLSKAKLITLFPLVYTGLHKKIKGVNILRGTNIEVYLDRKEIMQIDGEIYQDVQSVKISKDLN
ncbi:Putative lipid kinase YtlR [Metamycoplasma cloacale]|uniref:Transcriptional regulator n=1 Tax=Metamycoplasma cloacale TaxID=92401 RepID=A0A2Z4LLS4_9BACT|nr:diacylglycerol kinase family protein [Metamycoplasma cloacale]AWX42675.1 transcriptional regulator [Metamycoplasma cloacale]VEU79513.1 Putative lipid kinase YtlR [Metamycoplasma cloacale]